MPRVDRLFVLWGEPSAGRRSIIGRLWRAGGEFHFSYLPEGLSEAQQRGFKPLPEFPLVQDYHSRYLFSTFAQRIPSPKRPDYQAMLDAWGVTGDDQLEILAVSGGIQHTDTLELAEERSADDSLDQELRFRMAAERFFPDASRLAAGVELELRRDLSNDADPFASWLVLSDGKEVGYVPRQYAELVARHIKARHAISAAVVRRLPIPLDRGRWLIVVRRESRAVGNPKNDH